MRWGRSCGSPNNFEVKLKRTRGRIRVDNRARQRCQHTEERQDPEAYHESDWEGRQGNEGFNKKPCSRHGPLQQGGPIDEAVVNVLDDFEERQFELTDVEEEEKEEEAEGHQ